MSIYLLIYIAGMLGWWSLYFLAKDQFKLLFESKFDKMLFFINGIAWPIELGLFAMYLIAEYAKDKWDL